DHPGGRPGDSARDHPGLPPPAKPARPSFGDDQSRESARAAPAMASRSVNIAGLVSHGGGIIGGGVPFRIESASRSTVSMISGGGRVPGDAERDHRLGHQVARGQRGYLI
ncbi:MAG: hypothetical protein M3Z75_27425, partial [Actinomycetota bacterium]|nr:hypothetical protein [Actinomycetota bacterium]